jgi:hypothetical protein
VLSRTLILLVFSLLGLFVLGPLLQSPTIDGVLSYWHERYLPVTILAFVSAYGLLIRWKWRDFRETGDPWHLLRPLMYLVFFAIVVAFFAWKAISGIAGPAWPPDVAYIKLLLNLGVMGLGVGYAVWWSEGSLDESRDLVALFVVGAVLVAGGVGFLWLVGEPDIRGYLLLLEVGMKGYLIVVGYSLVAVGLVELGRKTFRRSSDDA